MAFYNFVLIKIFGFRILSQSALSIYIIIEVCSNKCNIQAAKLDDVDMIECAYI